MATDREQQLQRRVDPTRKALIERVAAASHLNVPAFLVPAAASEAEEVLAERSSIRLTANPAVAFTEALERPTEVNHLSLRLPRGAPLAGLSRSWPWAVGGSDRSTACAPTGEAG